MRGSSCYFRSLIGRSSALTRVSSRKCFVHMDVGAGVYMWSWVCTRTCSAGARTIDKEAGREGEMECFAVWYVAGKATRTNGCWQRRIGPCACMAV